MWPDRSADAVSGCRCGSSLSPATRQTPIVARTSGNPISANSKKPKPEPVRSNRASETMTSTVLPDSTSRAPALAANATGISS